MPPSYRAARIDESVGASATGHCSTRCSAGSHARQRGWFWQLQELPDAPESRYLYPVLAGNDFQEGLKNFRDLAYLGSTLARWDENMVVYNDMIDAREKAYAERIPRTDELMASGSLDRLLARREAVEGRYNDVINTEDVASLGTPQQREQWERVQAIEAGLATVPEGEEAVAAREKLRLIKGVLYWDLKQAFRDRLYQQRRELKSLDSALAEANTRWLRVQQARNDAPTTTGDFASRIAALQARMGELRGRLVGAGEAQGALLADIAVHELDAQKQRMADYEVQARFALASIYDRASEAPRAGKAMQNYRRFLDLQKTDPALRAEALRRLGDLSLERRARADRDRSEGASILAAPRRSSCTRCCSRPIRTIRATTRCSTSSRAPTKPPASPSRRSRRSTRSSRRFPQSREIPEVHFRRGELLFSAKRYARGRAGLCGGHAPGVGRTFYEQSPLQARLGAVQAGPQRESLPCSGGCSTASCAMRRAPRACASRSCRAPTASSSKTRCA
jgi:hypothetical protein